jgi:hypothetical protein
MKKPHSRLKRPCPINFHRPNVYKKVIKDNIGSVYPVDEIVGKYLENQRSDEFFSDLNKFPDLTVYQKEKPLNYIIRH